jgi:hypothetical protein
LEAVAVSGSITALPANADKPKTRETLSTPGPKEPQASMANPLQASPSPLPPSPRIGASKDFEALEGPEGVDDSDEALGSPFETYNYQESEINGMVETSFGAVPGAENAHESSSDVVPDTENLYDTASVVVPGTGYLYEMSK